MKVQIFKTDNGDSHMIDIGGNHFTNGRCVNPTTRDITPDENGLLVEMEIGDTHIPVKDRRPLSSGLKGTFEVYTQTIF